MRYFGLKAGKRRAPANWSGPEGDFEYVVLKQGVLSVQEKKICKADNVPVIREGVCGTPIIFAGKLPQGEDNIISKGMVGGFMFYTDNVIQTSPEAGMLYAYCQTTNELIDDGWRITRVDDVIKK